jgi:hypothetical protein
VFLSEALVEEGTEDGATAAARERGLGLLDWKGQGEKCRREMPRLPSCSTSRRTATGGG